MLIDVNAVSNLTLEPVLVTRQLDNQLGNVLLGDLRGVKVLKQFVEYPLVDLGGGLGALLGPAQGVGVRLDDMALVAKKLSDLLNGPPAVIGFLDLFRL